MTDILPKSLNRAQRLAFIREHFGVGPKDLETPQGLPEISCGTVSVITDAGDRHQLLVQWDAVRKQIYRDWEWLVVISSPEDSVWFEDSSAIHRFDGFKVRAVANFDEAFAQSGDQVLFLDDNTSFESAHIDSLLRLRSDIKALPSSVAVSDWVSLPKIGGWDMPEIHRSDWSYQHELPLGSVIFRRDLVQGLIPDLFTRFPKTSWARKYLQALGRKRVIRTNKPTVAVFE